MQIIIPSDKALPIMKRLGLPSWDKLDFQQRRQVAMEIYQSATSVEGKQTYDILSSGNSNANNFVYQVSVSDRKATNWPVIIGVGLALWYLVR